MSEKKAVSPKPSKPTPAKKPPSKSNHLMIFLTVLVIAVLGVLLGFNYAKMQNLVTHSSEMQASYQKMQQGNAVLTQSIQALSKQLSEQNQSISALQKNRSAANARWTAVEVEYLVNMANYALYFNHDVTSAIKLMNQADKDLTGNASTAALNARKAITADITNLKKVKSPDISTLYLQLNSIAQAIPKLPLIGSQPTKEKTKPSDIDDNAVHDWHYYWTKSLSQIKSLIIVRNNDQAVVPAVLHKQQQYYYQYLQQTIAAAKWAVLHQDNAVYVASLNDASEWLSRYFILSDVHAKSVMTELNKLKKQTWSQKLPDVKQSMQAVQQLNSES